MRPHTKSPPPSIHDIQAGAFLTDGVNLVQVIDVDSTNAIIENSRTYHSDCVELIDLIEEPWRLVKPAKEGK